MLWWTLRQLKSTDAKIRLRAVDKLRESRDPRAVQPLAAALKDETPGVREAAAKALGEIGDARAVEPLVAALKDEDNDVRQTAARSLGRLIGDTRAVEPLLAVLQSEAAWFRQAALEPLFAALKRERLDLQKLHVLRGVAIQNSWFTAAELAGVVAPFEKEFQELREEEKGIEEMDDWDNRDRARESIAKDIRRCTERAVESMSRGPSVVPLLVGAVKTRPSTPYMQWAVMEALIRIGSASVEALLPLLGDESDPARAAAQVLGTLRDPHAVEPLLAAMKHQDWRVREEVAKALGEIGDGRAAEPLGAALKDGDHMVRLAAVEALGQLGDPRAVQPLVAALKDEVKIVQHAAAKALGKIDDPRTVERLVAALKDTRWDVHRDVLKAAVEVLGKLGAPQGVDALVDVLYQMRLSDAGSMELLVAALSRQGVDVRRAAAWALGKIGDPRSVQPLVAALKDQSLDVRAAAAEALQVIDRDWHQSEAAREAVSELLLALKDERLDVRAAAAKALGEIGDPQTTEALLAALKDEYSVVRKAAAEALGKIGDPRAIGPLLELPAPPTLPADEADNERARAWVNELRLDDRRLRRTVAEALEKFEQAAMEPLLVGLKDERWWVRETAAWALGRIGDAPAIEPLAAALGDENWNVREAAAEALELIGGPEAGRAIATYRAQGR
jgi:HEAT repeat protein